MRRFDLVAFDVDGTLARHPAHKTVWEILNDRFCGNDGLNRERLAAFLSGRLSYADWVDLDIAGWRDAGATREAMVEAFGSITLVPGTREALGVLRASGLRLVVISGTLDLLLHTLLPGPTFDEIHANHVAFDGEGRIGHWRATPFDMQGKAVALRAIARREEIPLSRCAFVGDSMNDRWIAEIAGFTVAFNPKSADLEALAGAVVRSDDLRDVLPYLL